jgi:hypothetical protein
VGFGVAVGVGVGVGVGFLAASPRVGHARTTAVTIAIIIGVTFLASITSVFRS